MNGSYGKEREWTYIWEKGWSIIDYVIANNRAIKKVKRVEKGHRTESNQPIIVELEDVEKEKLERKDIKEIEKNVWIKKGVEHYHKKCEGWTCKVKETGEIWKELENKVKESTIKIKKKIRPWKIGRKEWHMKEWREKKR